MHKPDFQAAIAALTAKFAASLPEKRQALESAFSLWIAERDQNALKDVIGVAHKLAGSAGSYGFDALGHAARDLETEVRSWPDLNPPNATAALETERLFSALLRQFPPA